MKAARSRSMIVGGASPEGRRGGSALILTVVLTSLLAIVGVLFVMTTRVDRMATSALSESTELDLAVETVVGRICEQLAWDVPGTRLAGDEVAEYYDYPGPEDRWLAALEPNEDGTWPQISDVTVTGYLSRSQRNRNVPIEVVAETAPIKIDPADGSLADADGDAIADSKWIELDGVTSSKGRRIYAAVRVIDNCGMLNLNTGFEFDPCSPDLNRVDGTSLLQVNVMGLANRPGKRATLADGTALLTARANYGVGLDANDLRAYEDNVVWQYGELPMPYTPFEISDELELRNRFLLNQKDTDVRIERLGWTGSFLNPMTLEVPIGLGGSGMGKADWLARANIAIDRMRTPADIRYDYRHIATTCSMDRILNPAGLMGPLRPTGPPRVVPNSGKMANVNTASKGLLHQEITAAVPCTSDSVAPVSSWL